MDRYEYNVKSDQIKKLYSKKDYFTVAEIADTIDWSRVKSNSMLAMVADSYEGSKQYDKARDVLTIAYERSPLGRQLAYRLTILSLRMKDFVAADEYYNDFVEMAPRDVAQYILKYRISRAKGEDIDTLISILEAYVDVEMDERWQYELAKLYHESGRTQKCIAMCDKIILWFSEGKYVTKAMELKMKHEPLTEEQQAKYDGKWDYYNEKIKAEEAESLQQEEENNQEEAPETDNNTEEQVKEMTSDDSDTSDISDEEAVEPDTDNQEENAEEQPKPWEDMHDSINDTTALDYLTDYTEEDKVIEEPEDPVVDEDTAQEVEQQLAKMVEKSVIDVQNELESQEPEDDEDTEESGDNVPEDEEVPEDDEEAPDEEENLIEDEESEDMEESDDENDSDELNEQELVAQTILEDEENDEVEEDSDIMAEEEEEDYLEDETYNENEESEDDNEDDNEDDSEDELIEDEEESDIGRSDDKIEIFEFDENKSGKMKNIGDELTKTAEIDINEINVRVAQSVDSIYDTANIQEALAQSMKLIMKAESEKATRNAFSQSESMAEPTKRIDKEVKESESEEINVDDNKPSYETVPLQPIYDKDEDGQIFISEPADEDEQVEGQMSIEDVLSEFEKRKVEALEEAARNEAIAREAAKRAVEEAAAASEAVAKAIAEEAAARAALEKASDNQKDILLQNILPEDVLEAMPAMKELEENTQIPVSQIIGDTLSSLSETVKAIEEQSATEEEIEEESNEYAALEEEALDTDIPDDTLENSTDAHSEDNSTDEEDVLQEEASNQLSEENKKIFMDFLEIPGLESQIADTLDNLVNRFIKDGTSRSNNVVITGDAKTGKTTLALGVIKAANKGRNRNGRKVAKVKATALNKKGITAAMSQILGTDLIIEQAGNLMPGTVVDLVASMKAYTEEMIIVLEDDKTAIDRLEESNPLLKEMFTNEIYIKDYEINDLVRIAKEYAESQKYIVDEMGTLALYAKIDDISGKNQGISRSEIYEIIDEAIEHAERFKFSKLIGKLKRTRYEMGLLKEEDF